MDRPRSCRVIYYFDTSALGIRHQLFDRVIHPVLTAWEWLASLLLLPSVGMLCMLCWCAEVVVTPFLCLVGLLLLCRYWMEVN